MRKIIKIQLSISLLAFMLANCMPISCFAQNADFVVTQESKLIVPRINYGGSDLIKEGQKIYDRLMALYGGGIKGDLIFLEIDHSKSKVEELKSILEDYRTFLINLDNSQEVLKEFENGNISSLEMLTDKYFAEVPDYTESAILEDYFKRKGVPISEIRGSDIIPYSYPPYSYKQSLTDIQVQLEENLRKIEKILNRRSGKEIITKADYEVIRDICKKTISNLRKENLESIQAIYAGFEKSAAKIFPTPESKAEFLRYIWDRTIEIVRKNSPDSEARLLQGLFLRDGDTPKMVTAKLERFFVNLGKEAPKSVPDAFSSNMIKIISSTPRSQFQNYIAEVKKPLTEQQKALITDIQDYAYRNPNFCDSFFQDVSNGISKRTTAMTVAEKAAVATAKIVTPAVLILGSLWILDMVVNIDGSNNTFAGAISPASIKRKMKDGTANRYEQFAYYMMPSSAEYIEEDPVQFASVIFSAAEAITNPAIKKIMNDPIFKIEGYNPSKSVTTSLDKALDKAFDNLVIDDDISKA